MSSKQNETISTPGSGGLIHYNEEYKSKFQIKPEWVMIGIVAVVVGMFVVKIIF